LKSDVECVDCKNNKYVIAAEGVGCDHVTTGTQMSELSDRLNYDREVIRVWFCNKRQALKNTIKKLRTQE